MAFRKNTTHNENVYTTRIKVHCYVAMASQERSAKHVYIVPSKRLSFNVSFEFRTLNLI